MLRGLRCCVVSAIALAMWTGCHQSGSGRGELSGLDGTSNTSGSGETRDDGRESGAVTAGDDGQPTTGTGGGTGLRFDLGSAGEGTDGLPGLACSSDLRQVLDADSGAVVETCAADQGCLNGTCVAACVAAGGTQGSIGCEFLVPTPPFVANEAFGVEQDGPCHAVMVANTWDRPAQLEVSYGGNVYDATAIGRVPTGIGGATLYGSLDDNGLAPGQVAILFLSHRAGSNNNGGSLECPVAPAVVADTATHGTGTGEAFSVHSDTPVQVYDILPYGGARSYLPSASLLYPTTSWGQNYMAVSPHVPMGRKWIIVLAAQDDTTVTINPTVTFTDASMPVPPQNQATLLTLNAGQFVQGTTSQDLAGTIVDADKPIAVFTGNTYLRVTTADSPASGQDSAHQQIPAVGMMGSEYVGAGLYSRLPALAPESVMYRLVGVVDGTSLQWDPAAPANAPTTLNSGEVVEFESRTFFTVRAQDVDHPFALTHYMSGALAGQTGCLINPNGSPSCLMGDDEWMVMLPPTQFLQRYAFFVDPTYGTTTLVVTRVRGDNGFSAVTIGCMGEIQGWQPVGSEGLYEVAHVELFRGGAAAALACATSQHTASSDGAFGIEVWGTDYYASYGYPAGGNLNTLNAVVVNPAG